MSEPIANSVTLSVILPAKNEERGLAQVVPRLRVLWPDAEIIVVNDGSTDATAAVAESLGARVVNHKYGIGNGAAIKSGARAARGEVLIFMDADGQHDPEDTPRLLAELEKGCDMVVGARHHSTQASVGRGLANAIYNRLATWMVNQKVEDLTSGFRAVRAEQFKQFLHLLPNGFSYPTTITMAFFRAGYPVSYVPIRAGKREGKSHVRPTKDGLRFLLIMFRVGTLYSPLKFFVPIAFAFFLVGSGYYAYTLLTSGRFTNMSALLLTTSVIIFLIGLISEQITSLIYLYTRKDR